jgi:NH3-dependent NAD+ synthetase
LGFIAKYHSLRCEIQSNVQSKLSELIKPVFAKHEEDETKIQDYAEKKGIELETEISLSKIMDEFSRPFPFWVKWLINRKITKTAGERQAGFHIAVKSYMSQLRWTFFQACMFLGFMLSAAWYANAI